MATDVFGQSWQAARQQAVPSLSDDSRVPDDFQGQAAGYRNGWNDCRAAMLAAAPQAAMLRYTSDGALAECPCCGSLDVGGAHDTVNCYGCGLTVTKPRPLQNAIDAWNARTVRQQAPQAEQVVEAVAYLGAEDMERFLAGKYRSMTATLFGFAHP